MELRAKWTKKNEQVQQNFTNAFSIAEKIETEIGKYISITDEIDVLRIQQQNWQQNRFEIVVVGEFSTGKSTFLNALLQKDILPSKVTPTTATVNFIRHIEDGDGKEIAIVHFIDGPSMEVSFDVLDEYVTEMSKEIEVAKKVKYVDLFIDSPYLKDGVVLVDTPGLQALHPEHERITKEQIKKSNASILLFNMEQPGKQTEFKFLRELSDSIDRIFFIGNRLDGIPQAEVDEVVHMLEHTLKNNDFQKVPENRAKLFPLSAQQALKARDSSVAIMQWNNLNSEELLKQSRFNAFESHLESYLFEGDKAEDLLKGPYLSLLNFYDQTSRKIKDVQKLISGQVNLEDLEAQQQRAVDEIKLRELHLKSEVMRLKNQFQDEMRSNEEEFNRKFDKLIVDIQSSITDAISNEELVEIIQNEVEYFNLNYEKMVTEGIEDLARSLNESMRKEMNDFVVEINTEDLAVDLKVKANLYVNKTQRVGIDVIRQEIEKKYDSQKKEILDDKVELQKKIENGEKLKCKKMELTNLKADHQGELRFSEMLVNQTAATRKEYGLLKKNRFWFDKHGMKEVKNEEYNSLIEDRRRLAKENKEQLAEVRREQFELIKESSLIVPVYDTPEELQEARRQLRREKEGEYLQSVSKHAQTIERTLEKEKRRTKREIESTFLSKKREYRSFLRELDALKIAQDRISQYIESQDEELVATQSRLDEYKKVIEQTVTEQQRIEEIIVAIEQSIKQENTVIQIAII